MQHHSKVGIPAAAAAGSVLLSLLASCSGRGDAAASGPASQSPASSAPDPIAVTVEPAARESLKRIVGVVGTLHGDEEATISNKVAGRVGKIRADVGDVVAGGALLAEIETQDFVLAEQRAASALDVALARLGTSKPPGEDFDVDKVASVVRAAAELENAKIKLARIVELSKLGKGFVAAEQITNAETAVKVASATLDNERVSARALMAEARQRQAEVAQAKQQLSDTRVAAPLGERSFAVTARRVSPGEYLEEGKPLFGLVASDPLKLKAAVPERFTAVLKVGQQADVRVAAHGDRVFAGKISRINPSVDPSNRTFGIEVLVPNGAGELRPGSFGRADVLIGIEEAVTVPLDAIVSFAGITKIFTVRDGAARELRVVPGQRSGARVEIPGLESDAQVVTRGQTILVDGTPVRAASDPKKVGNAK
jgi:RND family efflux transporter MFP subunit